LQRFEFREGFIGRSIAAPPRPAQIRSGRGIFLIACRLRQPIFHARRRFSMELNVQKRRLGRTGLQIAPMVFGGNVFGWTANAKTSFDILDRFLEAGFNTIDTADVYSAWAPGNKGGESETIIGDWMKSRGNRADVIVVTKVGSPMGPGKKGLSAAYIAEAVEASLKRLKTDFIDLYLSHWPDAETPYEETLGAFEQLVKQGKTRFIGASNLNAEQLRASLDAAKEHSLPRYDVLQPEYNLYDRGSFEGPLRDLCIAEEIGVITYFSLAKGFLSGKYRSEADLGQSARGGGVKAYLNKRGYRILDALDAVAARNGAKPAEVALAWPIAKSGVTAPIASATSLAQLESLIKAASLALGVDDMKALDEASAI
jgi:aryl-alcohol dehydrogenase-like predicted oxidoreductase